MTATPANQTLPPKKGMNGLVIGCLVAVVLAVLCFVGFIIAMVMLVVSMTGPPVAAAEAFFKAASTQSPAVAYALTAPSYQSKMSQAAFEGVATRSKFTQVESESWNSRNLSGDTATISGQLRYKGGGEDPVTVTLQKSGEDWKIVAIDGPSVVAPTQ